MQHCLTGATIHIQHTTRKKPAQELLIDRQSMALLPSIAPATGTSVTTRLGRDYYVQIVGSVYSVTPEVIGRMFTATAGHDRVIARYGDRVWLSTKDAEDQTGLTTDPDHVAIAKAQHKHYNSRPLQPGGVEVQVADLSAYDRAFGTGEVA